MLEGFVVDCKYVVEEKLIDGRLLCHLLGDKGSKRVVPLGSRVKNELYYSGNEGMILTYDGIKVNVYIGSILTAKEDDLGLYLEGLFYMYSEANRLSEDSVYRFKGVDNAGNMIVKSLKTGVKLVIPKGVVVSPDEYTSWAFNGINTKLPEVGSDIWCISIKDDVIIAGNFEKIDDSESKLINFRCPNCNAVYDKDFLPVKISYLGINRLGDVDDERCSQFYCKGCSSIIIKSNERLGSICISRLEE